MPRSHRKVALVTGASSGIGKATACAFARAGYSTVFSDVEEEAGQRAVSEIGGEAGECMFMRCEVSDEADVRALIERILERYGRLDAAFAAKAVTVMEGE